MKYKSKSDAIKPTVISSVAKYSAAGKGMGKLLMGGAAALGVGAGVALLSKKKKKKEK
jgi:hypothetical protein